MHFCSCKSPMVRKATARPGGKRARTMHMDIHSSLWAYRLNLNHSRGCAAHLAAAERCKAAKDLFKVACAPQNRQSILLAN